MENLVELHNIKKDMFFYACRNYFKNKFYNNDECYTHKDLIKHVNKVNEVNEELNFYGLQLCIIDEYRPLLLQKEIFILIGGDTRYVSEPKKVIHCIH